MRVNIQPGDVLVARELWTADLGCTLRRTIVNIEPGDSMLVIACVRRQLREHAFGTRSSGAGIDHYVDYCYVHALLKSNLVETIVMIDRPFCTVIRTKE